MHGYTCFFTYYVVDLIVLMSLMITDGYFFYYYNEQRDARKRNGPPNAYGNDSYNMEEIVMPLHEFINHPVALDIIHNGATFQV